MANNAPAQGAVIPALPPGFTLDSAPSPQVPALPAGFTLDSSPSTPDDAMVTAAMQHQASLPAAERQASLKLLPATMQHAISAKIAANARAAMAPQAEAQRYRQALTQTVASMPWYQQAVVGAGHGVDQLVHGAEQIGDTVADKLTGGHRLARLNAELAANSGADSALMHSGWAQAGSIGAQVAATLPFGAGVGEAARALGVGAKALPFVEGAIGNGALAGLEPTRGSHLVNGLAGAAVGAALPAAGKALGVGARVVRNGVQYITDPGAVADRAIARAFGPDALVTLSGAEPDAAGMMHTAAQDIGGQRAIAAEQAMRRAGTGAQFVAHDVAVDAARLAHLQQFAGTSDTLQAAHDARDAAMVPYAAALAGKRTPVAPILDAVNGLRASTAGKPVANAALDDIERTLGRRGVVDKDGTVPLEAVEGLRSGLGDIIHSAATRTGLRGARNSVAMRPIENALNGAIREQVPGFDNYMQDYARLSEPINTQSTLQDFLDRVGQQDHNAVKQPAIREGDTRKLLADIERSEFGVSPQAKQAVQDVHDSLLQDHLSKVNVGGASASADASRGAHLAHGLYGLLQRGMPYRGIPGPVVPLLGATAGGFIGDKFHHPEWGALAGAALGSGAAGLLAQRIVPLIGERAANSLLAGQALERATVPLRLSLLGGRLPFAPWLAPAAATTASENARQ